MALMLTIISIAGSILLTPFLMLLVGIIFLASIGKSLGVRRLYVKTLLMIFEYGRKDIESSLKNRQKELSEDIDEGYSEEITPPERSLDPPLTNGVINGRGNTLINKDEGLILVPEPPTTKTEEAIKEHKEKYKDFELSNVFEFVKAGVEAIIEDEVTSRFEAEELKNWNLLIRTNRGYEFISWKLTFLWLGGFFIRYFFLFPLRLIICCFGIALLIASTFSMSILSEGKLKRWLNEKLYKICFRVIAQGVTAIIKVNNKHWRPARASVCVANHTSPIDIMTLSTDNCYSLVFWLTLCTALVGYVKPSDFKTLLNKYVSIMCFGILSRAISSVITYHNEENRPKNGICVANHTSPIDVLVLMCDNCYSLIGQRHGGFLGIFQRALARASPHIWFERSETRDRSAVANRLKEHVSNPKNPPILIFPEGTCINNTSVMQFKKGSFEVGSVIYPVAIKYDPRFGDAFWNSSRYSMVQYLYMMMTSWAIVCDVWYLPPMYQREDETAINFANRVKSVVAKQGGLVDLMWDGQLKRVKAKKEWRERQQEEFSKRLQAD